MRQVFGYTGPTPKEGYAEYLMVHSGTGGVRFSVRGGDGVVKEISVPSAYLETIGDVLRSATRGY